MTVEEMKAVDIRTVSRDELVELNACRGVQSIHLARALP